MLGREPPDECQTRIPPRDLKSMMGRPRTWSWSFIGLLLVVLLAEVFVWQKPSPQLLQARDRARRAWEIRHVQGLEEALEVLAETDDAEVPLLRARVAFLQGRFLPCLDLLARDSQKEQEEWDSLREQTWEALALDVPWPATVPAWVRLPEGDLVRVVDDGDSEGLFLEAFGERQGLHALLKCVIQRPDGAPARIVPSCPWAIAPPRSRKDQGHRLRRVEHLRQGRRTGPGDQGALRAATVPVPGASAPILEERRFEFRPRRATGRSAGPGRLANSGAETDIAPLRPKWAAEEVSRFLGLWIRLIADGLNIP